MDSEETCTACKKAKAEPPHACPYAVDIHGNEDPKYCNCCSECQNHCYDDI